MTSSWSTEETNLLIRKRLEMFGCARSDKVYDQISLWLAEEHNFYVSAGGRPDCLADLLLFSLQVSPGGARLE